ncbi:MAG: respiratory nitrate reductase subunit gamma [Paracoccaceae bacterium]
MHNFFFGIYPYIALSVLLIGSVARYERDPFTWKSSSSQLLRRKQLILGSVLFHVGVLVVFFGHLIGLLTPIWIFDAMGISHGAKQILAIVAGGIAGIMALVGGILLLHRRLMDPRIYATTSFADVAILVLLLAQLVLGIGTIFVSLQHLDGGEMVTFMAWAQGIFTFQPDAAEYIRDANWIFKLHLFLGLTIFLVFPFTRLVHMLSVPVRYLWRPGYQVVRSRRKTVLPRTPAE